MHVTAGALLVRGTEFLLVEHRAYGIVLQPGGHLEPDDVTLAGAAERELEEETGIDPGAVFRVSEVPVYVEFGRVPARPAKDEPGHFHLDFGFAFGTTEGDVGRIQESEVNGASWYPLAVAERLVGHRIGRAVSAPPDRAVRDTATVTAERLRSPPTRGARSRRGSSAAKAGSQPTGPVSCEAGPLPRCLIGYLYVNV